MPLFALVLLLGASCADFPADAGADSGASGGADAGVDSGDADGGPDGEGDAGDGGIDSGDGAHPAIDGGDAGPVGEEDGGSDGGGIGDGGNEDAGAAFPRLEVNVPEGPLCDIPPGYVESGGDPVFIRCDIAADRFAEEPPAAPDSLKVVAWNVEFGKEHDRVLASLTGHPRLAGADVLLLSEVSRDSLTSRPQRLDQARELARLLRMDYAFAVEWDRREKADEQGEHGVAILSRYPLGNVVQIRHVPLNDFYAGERLYGGRITLGADLRVGSHLVRVWSSHLCTRGIGDGGRAKQAAEIRLDADRPGVPSIQVVGGDLNTYTCNPLAYPFLPDCTKPPRAEKTVQDFLAAGWLDGTEGFNGITQLGKGVAPQRLDWIFYRGAAALPGTASTDARGSDHYPLDTTLLLP